MEEREDVDMVKALLDKFDQNPDLLKDLTDEELQNAAKATSIYGNLPNKGTDYYSVVALSYLQKEFQNAIALAGTIGYMFNKMKNWEPEPPPELLDEQTDPVEFRKKYPKIMREPVERFLNENFAFNPDVHVSKFGDGFKIEDVEMPYEPFKGQGDYITIHHDRLKDCMVKAFGYKPMTEYVINIFASHKSLMEAEAEYQAARKLTNTQLYLIQEGRNHVFGEENQRVRAALDIDGPGTEVIKAVMDKHKREEELRKQLLKKTVKQAKIKNIREMGPDDESFLARANELYPDRQINSLTEQELNELNKEYKQYQVNKNYKTGQTVVPMTSVDITGKATESVLYTELENFLELQG